MKTIVLGITGGIAAYKAAELCRLLVKAGFDVQVVMSDAAQQFITPLTMQALSGKPVLSSLWSDTGADGMAHIHVTRAAVAMVVAPATADFLSRASMGLSDDLLLATVAARPRDSCPLLLAAAMNHQMWRNPATQRSIEQLRQDGVQFVGPQAGEQACGEVGMGRISEPQEILQALEAMLKPKLLQGKKLLVTAGPTFEPLDPVRGLTNRSSGKMGYAIARAAQQAGAAVTLVSGPTALAAPYGVALQRVETAEQMLAAVQANMPQDVFIATAAVADWRPLHVAAHKQKKAAAADSSHSSAPSIELCENPDILAWVAKHQPNTFCLGFAAETENLEAYARAKLQSKGIAMIAVNHGPSTFQQDHSELWLIDAHSTTHFPPAEKTEHAWQLIEALAKRLPPSVFSASSAA